MSETKTKPEAEETIGLAKRESYPDGVTCWVDADLPDPGAARDFYGDLFGWEFEDTMPVDMEGNYFIASIDGLSVGAIGSQASESAPAAWNTYISVASAEESVAKVFEAGGTVIAPPFDFGEAGRMAICADPQGAAFRIWEPRAAHGAQLVNTYGAWNFSGLTTSDPEAAIAFYNAVFGWEAEMDDSGWTFFRVPGYGKFIDEHNPGFIDSISGQDAPPGFADVTAWLSSTDGQPAETPPSWSVTFAAEDVDASVAEAKKLGGAVIVEPFDNPPVRTAVLADPQGAVFAVSRYYPPDEES